MNKYKVILFLNSLNPDEQERFANFCGTSTGYIRKVCSSKNKPDDKELFFGPIICRKMEQFTSNTPMPITRKYLRPHDWHMHWPELAQKQNKEVA